MLSESPVLLLSISLVPNSEFISGYTNRLLKHVDSVKMDSQRFESADPSRHGAFE
jgi:hypothetical protein